MSLFSLDFDFYLIILFFSVALSIAAQSTGRGRQMSERIDKFPACCCSVILFEWSSELANSYSRPGGFKQQEHRGTERLPNMPVFTGMTPFKRHTSLASLKKMV